MFELPQLSAQECEVRDSIEELGNQLKNNIRVGNRWTGALRRSTLARNIQGSNSIEGINATLDEIEAIAAGDKSTEIDEETFKAIEGYQLAMTYVLQLAKGEFAIDNSLLRSLHFMVSSYDMTKWPGRFRPGPVYVQEDATGLIVHEGAPADKAPGLIAEMAEQLSDAQNDEGTDLILTAAMAHLNFVLVHPFKDGNGRMARILQSLVIAKDEEFAPVFMTTEEYLGRHTHEYYRVLAQVGQGNWSKANYDPELARPWVRFMLTAHWNQALELQQRIASASEAAQKMDAFLAEASLPDRAIEALYSAMFGGTVTRTKYIAALQESGETVTAQTASRDLGALVSSGLLVPLGDKRGRKYVPSERVQEASRAAGLGYAWRQVDPFAR